MTGDWTPANEPAGYDKVRVERLRPVVEALRALGLPLLRWRKLNSIATAIEMQIEDGGDSPEVNRLLLEALREGLRHQLGDAVPADVQDALGRFEQAEAERWEHLRAGTLPSVADTDEARLSGLIRQGADANLAGESPAAVAAWQEAWELVKRLHRPDIKTTDDFDAAHPELYDYTLPWTQDLEATLGELGADRPELQERRLAFVREFLSLFPQESDATQIDFLDAEADALWQLGRRDESEALAARLVERFPDHAAAYVRWTYRHLPDQAGQPNDYARAEAILKPALDRPKLDDRNWVLRELADLYHDWGKHDEEEEVRRQLPSLLPPLTQPQRSQPDWALPPTFAPPQPTVVVKPGRNAPCWCGSSKKYKKCHLAADEAAERQRPAGG